MSAENEENLDKILLFEAGHGDAEAFGEIFDKYNKKVYRFIYFRVSSQELAEDLASQTFLKVWEHLSAGGKIKQLTSYLYQTARNLVVDYYRQREKEELPLIYSEEMAAEIKVDPEAEISKETLEKLLNSLSGEQREIIILKYLEGFSIKEIAEIVEKSSGHVRVIIHRAIKELRKFI